LYAQLTSTGNLWLYQIHFRSGDCFFCSPKSQRSNLYQKQQSGNERNPDYLQLRCHFEQREKS